MSFNVNDFKIVHGATMEEIEEQVKILIGQGYGLHGAVVAQPNPHFNSTDAFQQKPYLYYQMLARHKKNGSGKASGESLLPDQEQNDL